MKREVCEMGGLHLPYEQQPLGMRLLHPLLLWGRAEGKKCCNISLNQPANSIWRGDVWVFLPAGPLHAMRKGRGESKGSLLRAFPRQVFVRASICLFLEQRTVATWSFLRLRCHSGLNLNRSQRIN